MYWEKELERLERGNLEKLQINRLIITLQQAARAPFYDRMPQIGKLLNTGIKSIEQIRELPFTT